MKFAVYGMLSGSRGNSLIGNLNKLSIGRAD